MAHRLPRQCSPTSLTAEAFLYTLGVTQVRVRYDGKNARIEIGERSAKKSGVSRDPSQKIGAKLKALGIPLVTLDLEGYRSGVFNTGLKVERVSTEPFA